MRKHLQFFYSSFTSLDRLFFIYFMVPSLFDHVSTHPSVLLSKLWTNQHGDNDNLKQKERLLDHQWGKHWSNGKERYQIIRGEYKFKSPSDNITPLTNIPNIPFVSFQFPWRNYFLISLKHISRSLIDKPMRNLDLWIHHSSDTQISNITFF